jgi:hypothetical protein
VSGASLTFEAWTRPWRTGGARPHQRARHGSGKVRVKLLRKSSNQVSNELEQVSKTETIRPFITHRHSTLADPTLWGFQIVHVGASVHVTQTLYSGKLPSELIQSARLASDAFA